MSKSPWGTIGAWAAEAEREEAEEREAAERAAADAAVKFPSLKDAVNTKQKKKTKMTLQEFNMQPASALSSAASRGLTPEEMLRLPTGPKERSSDEMQYGRLGGGFSNYGTRPGGGGSGSGTGRGREFEGGRRSYGFEDDNPRGRNQVRVSEFNQQQQPSRADEVDNWGSMKKSLPEYDSGVTYSGGKHNSLGGNAVAGSRADEVDNWASVKRAISQPQQRQSRSSGFGSGFSKPEPERWTRNEGQRSVVEPPKNEVEEAVKANKPNPFGTARPREEVLAEKGLDWKKLEMEFESKKQQHSGGGSRPGSSHSSRPGSSHSSRSEVRPALLPGMIEIAAKQKPKVNPFGNAKPREVILEEKGLDWKKIDLHLEHRRVERPLTETEKNLKEEIELLNKELQQKSGENQTIVKEILLQKQQELDLLISQLDDNVRYSQKGSETHASGAGKGSGFQDQPPSRQGSGNHDRYPTMPGVYEEHRTSYNDRRHSQTGMYEDPRTGFPDRAPSLAGAYGDPRAGFSERPHSRPGAYEHHRPGFSERPHSRSGTYEDSRAGFPHASSVGTYQEPRTANHGEKPHSLAKPSDDRRAFQGGGGGRGFQENRDRSGSRW